MMKTPKETSVLIAFQKPAAIWDLQMEDVPQLAVQDLKTTCSKKYNINTSHIATIEYYILHVIYKWYLPSQTMISIPGLMWRPRSTIKRFAREMHTRDYRALYKG